MKKKIIFLLLFIMSMTACSSVSQEDYNSKTKELENMKTELANIQTELSNTQKEYADYKKQIVEEEMAKSGAKGWATTAFGEHAQAIVYDNDLYVNIPTGYTISEKSIKALSDHLKNGEFSPLDFEIGFGPKTSLPAIVIELKNNSKLILTGTIDRIDVLRKEGKNYVKIIFFLLL